MKKNLIASSIALGLGISSTAEALTIKITEISDCPDFCSWSSGVTYDPNLNLWGAGFRSVDPFFGAYAYGYDQPAYGQGGPDGGVLHTGTGTVNWSGTSAAGPFSYTYELTNSNQIAVGTYFKWNPNGDQAVMNIMQCTDLTPGSTCVGQALPMQNGPFVGHALFSLNAVIVPIPAAAWLFGSGLLGLIGISRRKNNA